MAPLLAEVEVALNERSSRSVADQLVGDFKKAGAVAGREFRSGLSDSMTSSQLNAFTSSFASSVAPQFQRHGRQAGEAFGRGFELSVGQIVTRVVTSLGLAGAASAVLYKGFERYEAIDAAKNRLDSLNRTMAGTGRAALDVGQVMETVTKTVEGTPFALDQAFSIATRALATNTGDLKRFMTDVADAAGFAGTDIGRIGEAFLDVANQGKVSMEQLGNQLQDIPIQAWLAETMHKSSAEISEMISQGKVGLEDLMRTVEQHAPGFAKAAGDTVQGAMANLQTSVARLGANFLGALFGQPTEDGNELVNVLKTLQERIDEVGQWVTAHQNDIRRMFDDAADVAGNLASTISEIIDTLGHLGIGVDDVVQAFVAWKTIEGVIALTTSLTGINTMLATTIPASAATAATGITGAFSKIVLPAWIASMLLNKIDEATGTNAGTALEIPGSGVWFFDRIFGDKPWFPGKTVDGSAVPSSEPPESTPGSGPSGLPILPPGGGGSSGLPKAPQIPYPAAYGQPPGPGESVEHWQARMAEIDAEHDLAEKRARVTQLQADANATADDVVKAQNDAVQAQIRATRTTEALRKADLQQVVAPYDPRYGVMRPGETAAQYGAESSFFEAQHDRAQAEADLKALQDSGTASTAELAAAQNKLIKARDNENQALLRLNETSNKTAKTMGDLGAQLDSDLGASKGLPGLAENLTRFLANLGFAPVLGALRGIQVANGFDQSDLGGGIIGALGATGVFGQQFVKSQDPYSPLSSGAGTAATSLNSLAAAANTASGALGGGGSGGGGGSSGAYSSDAALLSNVPAGTYSQTQAADLTKGIGDCSSAVEDLVNIMDGRPTGGRSMSTGNAAEWLTSRGFLPGEGGPGDFRVGFSPSHMQATLPGGTPFNWGSDAAAARHGIGGTGAFDPSFTSNYYRPTSLSGGGGGSSASSSAASAGGGGGSWLGNLLTGAAPGATYPALTGPALTDPALTPAVGPISGTAGGGAGGGIGSGLGSGVGYVPQSLGIGAPGLGVPSGPSILGLDPGGADPSQSVAGGRAFGQGVPASGGIGIGGGGLLGMAGSAAQGAIGLAASGAAGGMDGGMGGAAASALAGIGIQEIQRAISAGGQYVGALAGGLLETFSLNDSALADPGKSWLGRIGVAVAGARPALPNSAGEMGGKENKNMAEGGKKPPGPMSPQQAKGGKDGQPGADGANGSNVGKGDGTTYNLSVTNNNNNTRFDPTHNDMQNLMSASAASRQPR